MRLTTLTSLRPVSGRSVLAALFAAGLLGGCAAGSPPPAETPGSPPDAGAMAATEAEPSAAADLDVEVRPETAAVTTAETNSPEPATADEALPRGDSTPVQAPPSGVPGGAHLAFVARLIEESSAAAQVESSDNPAAHARRDVAREQYRQAVAAAQAGDAEQADELGKEATRQMFEAVRLAESEEVVGEKRERDYARRLESVRALLEAHQRVGTEDRLGSDFARSREQARDKLSEAEALHGRGELATARGILDEAYVALKLSIQAAREGATRVRTLDFATKAEEYQHELGRNDTHQRLVGLFMQDAGTSEGARTMVARFVEEGESLRRQAEQQASRGDHAAAVESLEASTGQYIRALRTVGIFIPG
ncbi:hypothetical protein DU490_12990 [Halomonas sp. DQ26W]|uniref:hypothetical protein n=1 Tax=Halomonas sp. DQ26W TaxID=2282311 RepID=UPI000DF76B0D|nr:hypothetical protein [Halomonas sp. DQ26W]RDB42446.1 hypothetical protein DU490_12990 [Halomonas sp. DQ26W]